MKPGPEIIKYCSCSTQLRIKLIMLINVKIPTIVCILTFIVMLNTIYHAINVKMSITVGNLIFISMIKTYLRV